jgi:hypothetical protein
MSRSMSRPRQFCARVGMMTTLFLLGLAAAGAGGNARAEPSSAQPVAPAKADPPRADTKAGAKDPPVKENVKQLGQEATDPSTLQRIKAHEQELEKKIVRTRDRQRKDHGTARPGDAVDLAKSLDDPDGRAAPTPAKAPAKAKAKAKATTTTTTPPPR